VAAVAVLRQLRIPHRVLVVLEGESLVNDATALVLYRTAVAAMITGSFDLGRAVGEFLLAAVGGVIVGLVVGRLALLALRWTADAVSEIAVTLLAPYIAWSVAERAHTSAVLACVAGGLYLRRYFSAVVSPGTRLQARAVWDLLVFALNGVIFILIGLQLRTLVQRADGTTLLRLTLLGLLVSLVAIVTRALWVPTAAILPRLVPSIARRDPMPPWSALVIVAWTGMRGIVSLASALALPLVTAAGAPLPLRDEIVLVTFVVILVTLVAQGLTLGPIIRHLELPEDRTLEQEEAHARDRATAAALERLDALAAGIDSDAVAGLRRHYEQRARAAEERRSGVAPSSSLAEAAFKRARHETLAAERRSLIDLRNRGVISDEVMLELERELDVEAARHGLAEVRPDGRS
jgi:CPA1 family monovalent cation:H+ antiporter